MKVVNEILTGLVVVLILLLRCDSSSEKKQSEENENQTYKNLHPNVRYVGIMACRQCHYAQYETFIETGMGKSFDIASIKKSSAKWGPHAVIYDKHSNFYYHASRKDDSLQITEFRLNKKSKDTVYKRVQTVHYIVGSGQHTNSHIYHSNGYLYQMPMTFYTQQGKWDLPPGFENGFNTRFSRKIGLECMSCHNALPDFVIGSENKYSKIPNGISCERCHGPGEVHVKEKTAGVLVDTSRYIDYSIVNPGKLSASLQFDICQRCHLQGNAVLKKGKSFFDFRPGMKLSEVMSVFLPKYENAENEFIMASHADRLQMSKCFAFTLKEENTNALRPYKNGLTCVTCHNPHISVKVTGKEVFNNVCKNCHGKKINVTCTEKSEARNKIGNNCISCHMPASGSTDIPHVSITDHFIRKPMAKDEKEKIKKFIGLVAVNEKKPEPEILAEGYINQYEKFEMNSGFLDSAEKYLNKNSLEHFEILVRLHFLRSDFEKIISLASRHATKEWLKNTVMSFDNKNAWTCYRIAEALQQTGNVARAHEFYLRATELAPFNLEFLNKLAGSYFVMNKTNEAEKIYRKIISEDANFAPAWCNLGYIYFLKNDFATAEKYYDKALSLDPDYSIARFNKKQLIKTRNGKKEKTNY